MDPDGHKVVDWIKTAGQAAVGVIKEGANIVISASPVVMAADGMSNVVTGNDVVPKFNPATLHKKWE